MAGGYGQDEAVTYCATKVSGIYVGQKPNLHDKRFILGGKGCSFGLLVLSVLLFVYLVILHFGFGRILVYQFLGIAYIQFPSVYILF